MMEHVGLEDRIERAVAKWQRGCVAADQPAMRILIEQVGEKSTPITEAPAAAKRAVKIPLPQPTSRMFPSIGA